MAKIDLDFYCFLKRSILQVTAKRETEARKLVDCQLSLFNGDLKSDKRKQLPGCVFSRINSMGTKLYVGNLPFNTTENELQELFSQAGAVQEVTLMQDRFTGKSRGFAFVTMGTDEEAQNAISKFNGHTMDGRPMTVNEARPREQRPPGGGGGGGGRYGGGGYGGGRRDGGQRRGGY